MKIFQKIKPKKCVYFLVEQVNEGEDCCFTIEPTILRCLQVLDGSAGKFSTSNS